MFHQSRGHMKSLLLAAAIAAFFAALMITVPIIRNGIETGEGGMELKKANTAIMTIYDNYQQNPELETGFGFGCIVRTGGKTILFDTGSDSQTLLENMDNMGIKPEEIDMVVISHIHGDHTGGLDGFLEKNHDVTVYIPASFPDSFREGIKKAGAEYADVSKPTNIIESIGTTGELGTWIREQSLLVNTPKGLVVITGGAHPGIVHIVEEAKRITGRDVYLVMGGFHLGGSSDSALQSIIEDFRRLGVQKTAPCHCSGDRAREMFQDEYGNDYISNGVGMGIEI